VTIEHNHAEFMKAIFPSAAGRYIKENFAMKLTRIKNTPRCNPHF